ncbi:hypothetical protein D3C87_1858900 [compost metagenome]
MACRALDDEFAIRRVQLALGVAQLRALLAHGFGLLFSLLPADYYHVLWPRLPLRIAIAGGATYQHAYQQPRKQAQHPAQGAGLRAGGCRVD